MSNEKKWFFRKSDGAEYGPVSLAELRRWSVESRVLAGNEISTDKKRWHLIEELQDLDMNWVAQRPDGLEYGPFNIRATTELHRHDVLPAGTSFRHKATGETHTLEEVLQELGTPLTSDQTSTTAQPQATPPEESMPQHDDQPIDQATEEEPTAESSQRIDALVAELDRVTVELETAQKESQAALAALRADHTAAIETLHDEHAAASEALQATVAERTAELAELRDRDDAAHDTAATTIAALKAELDDAQRALAKAEDIHTASLRDLTESSDELTHNLNEAKQQHVAEVTALRDELTSWQERGTSFESRLGTLETEQEAADSQHQQATTELRHQVIFMKKNSANLTTDLEHTRSKLYNLRLTVLAVLGLAALAIMLTVLFNNSGCRPSATEPAQPTAAPDAAPQGPPSGGLDLPPEADADGTTPGLAGAQQPPVWPTIEVEGVRAIPARGTLKLVFVDGLFTSWDNLGPDAKATLQQLAKSLTPLVEGYRLEIEGHTDNQPLRSTERYANNNALGKARADAVVAFLASEGGLPATMLQATSAGDQRPPHPNSSTEARRRNRTVVLILRRGR